MKRLELYTVLKGSATEKLWDEFSFEIGKLAKIPKEIAVEFSFEFVPLQAEFDKLADDGNTRYWSVDGIHPTSAGHQVIKEELQEVIAKYVNEC